MKISDNANFLIIQVFFAEIVIHILKKITQRIESWLSPIGQDLKSLFTALNLLLVRITINLKICLVNYNFKPCRLFPYLSSMGLKNGGLL